MLTLTIENVIAIGAVLVALAVGIFGIIFGMSNYQKSTRADAERQGQLLSDVGYIKKAVDTMDERFNKIDTRIDGCEKRIDKIETERNIEKKKEI